MSVKILIDNARVAQKITDAWGKALPLTANEILADCNEYCKYDKGALIQSSLIHSRMNDGLLVWQTPYARRQYWEIKTAYKDMNPKATWRWCEVAHAKNRDKWEKLAQREFEKNL